MWIYPSIATFIYIYKPLTCNVVNIIFTSLNMLHNMISSSEKAFCNDAIMTVSKAFWNRIGAYLMFFRLFSSTVLVLLSHYFRHRKTNALMSSTNKIKQTFYREIHLIAYIMIFLYVVSQFQNWNQLVPRKVML